MGEETKKQHSPTPWRVEKNLYGTANIIETEGRQIAACSDGVRSFDPDEEEASAKLDEANAAFIVEAVNGYEAMRKEYDKMNGIAADLQRSRAKIIEDNNRLREALTDIKTFAAEIFRTARSAAIKADADEIHGLCTSALGEEACDGND